LRKRKTLLRWRNEEERERIVDEDRETLKRYKDDTTAAKGTPSKLGWMDTTKISILPQGAPSLSLFYFTFLFLFFYYYSIFLFEIFLVIFASQCFNFNPN
jgi:hypothetical protein